MALDVQRDELLRPEVRRTGLHALVRLSGELDASTAGILYEQFAELSRDGVCHVALDLSELTFTDSTGLSVLVAEHKRAAALGGELIVLSPQHSVRRLFQLMGLCEYLNIRPEHAPVPDDGPEPEHLLDKEVS